ncbi:electron transfer flavoprotein subunit alpha/FixB family protein [bacterium]|nr:electron transfer flavoprotein subunit alpha/FixB family protein [bacterium]
MKGSIYVFMEEQDGAFRKGSLQALTVGLDLAKKLGTDVAAVVLSAASHDVSKELGRYGIGKAIISNDAAFGTYLGETWCKLISECFAGKTPCLFLGSATGLSRDLFPRLAQKLDGGYLGDVTGYAQAGDAVHWERPIYAGKATEFVEMLSDTTFITLRPNSFPMPEDAAAGNVAVEQCSATGASERSRIRECIESTGLDKVELTEADIVVSGGMGVGGPEGYAPLKALCKELGAALGASRAAVHASWIDPDHQVGQTGKTVSPSLYVACGISGQIQHQAGMRTSKCIVAINTDPEAPIFQVAHYGIVQDLHKVVPVMTEEIKKVKTS